MTSVGKSRDLSTAFLRQLRRFSTGRQLVILAASLSIGTSAFAQGMVTGGGTSSSSVTNTGSNLISQVPAIEASTSTARSSTILPTDVVPLPAAQERTSFGENMQLRILQRLPAPFYFNASVEASVREETNVFQFPTKRKFLTQLPRPSVMAALSATQQGQILNTLNHSDAFDTVFRVLPNVTWGWALKPRTRVYGNYFMIRDELTHWTVLNTVIHSIGYGIQQDLPVGRRGNMQFDFQCRELYQLHSKPVFDFLPGATFSYVLTPRTVLFVNTLAQLRGKGYFRSPNKEIDPFYTWGGYYAKNGWAFSATSTFVQNFRQPFHSQATIPVNNYSIISDFEIARRLIKQLPGLQAFARAEPIWNFHSHSKPGLTGMDFRMFFGVRMQVGKPALTAAYEQIKQQLEEQETTPPPPGKTPGEPKPSAFLMPYQVIAGSVQPIHGFLGSDVGQQSETAYPQPVVVGDSSQTGSSTASDSALAIALQLAPSPSAAEAKSPVGTDELPMLVLLPPAVATAPAATASTIPLPAAVADKPAVSRSPKQVNHQAHAKKRHSQVEMVLVPPLPTVNADSRANPFGGSGADLKPPMLMRPIR